MKLLIFGASGETGKELVSQSLRLGHDVTAFVRDPQKLATNDPRLRPMIGEMLTADPGVAEAMQGQEVVISTLGVRGLRSGDLIERSLRTIVSAMRRQRVRRLIVVSAFGVGDTYRDASLPQRVFYKTMLRNIFADKLAGEMHVTESDLDWTIVYPVSLVNAPGTGRYRVGERLPMTGMPKISRADVAHFVLAQVQDRTYVRKGAVISQ